MPANTRNNDQYHDLCLLNCVFNLMRGERPYVPKPPTSLISPNIELYGRIERSGASDVLDHIVQGLHPHSESRGTITIGPYHTLTRDFSLKVMAAMGLYKKDDLTIEEEAAELKDVMALAVGARSFRHLENALKRDEVVQKLHPYFDEMFAWVGDKIANTRHELKVYGSGNENKRKGCEGDLRVWPRMEDVMHDLQPVVTQAVYKGVLDGEAIDRALVFAHSHLPELRKEINDWFPLATALQIGLVESALEAGIKKDASANREAMKFLQDTAASWHLYLEESRVEYWPANTRAAELALQQPAKRKTGDEDFLVFARCLHDMAQTYQAAKKCQFPDKSLQTLRALYRNDDLGKPALVM